MSVDGGKYVFWVFFVVVEIFSRFSPAESLRLMLVVWLTKLVETGGLSITLIFIRLMVFVLCVSSKLQSGRGYLPFCHLSCSAVVNRAVTAASSLGVNFASCLQYKRPAHLSTYCQIFNLLPLHCVRLSPPAFLDKRCPFTLFVSVYFKATIMLKPCLPCSPPIFLCVWV